MNKENAIKELKKLIKEEHVSFLGDLYNLKLHEIAYTLKNEEDMMKFYNFCDLELEEFNRILRENFIDLNHFNRTSSFYLNSSNILYSMYDFFDYRMKTIEEKKEMLIEEILYYQYNIYDNEDYEDYTKEELQDAVKDVLGDDIKKIITIYSHIENFKKNQIEIWNSFIE